MSDLIFDGIVQSIDRISLVILNYEIREILLLYTNCQNISHRYFSLVTL